MISYLSLALHEISKLLDVGIDRAQLPIVVALSECGVSPQALAEILLELENQNS